MEKWNADKIKENKVAIKIVYALFVSCLIGLMFIPTVFFGYVGFKFKGGQTIFKAIKLLVLDLIKNGGNFALTFSVLNSIKWIFFAYLGVVLINAIVLVKLFLSHFSKGMRSTLYIITALSLSVFLALSITYIYKLNEEYYRFITSAPVLLAAISAIFVLIIGIISKNKLFKWLLYLFSLMAIAGLFYRTFFLGGTYFGAYQGVVESFSIFKHLPQLIKLLASTGISKFVAIVYVYGLIATAVLVSLNFIISAFSLKCEKVSVFDIVRYLLTLIVAATYFIVSLTKFGFVFKKSYGFIAVLASLLIATTLSFIGYFFGKKKCECEKIIKEQEDGGTPLPDFDFDISKKHEPHKADDLEKQPTSPLEERGESLNFKFEDEKDIQFTPPIPQDEPQVLIEEVTKLEYENKTPFIKTEEIEKEPEKQSKKEIEDTARQLDIESLKAEILADIYMREKTQTMADVQKVEKPVINPKYEIKEKEFYESEQKTAQFKNPYMQIKKQAPNDRFFDSLTEGEKQEFSDIFIKKLYGENKRLPEYVIGGDNTEFFSKVFIFIGRFRSVISETLLSKIYLYSVSL